MRKTEAAFLFTARGLFERYRSATGKNHRVYFWTVTFNALRSDWETSKAFSAFLDHLRKVVGKSGWGGVRVAELHKEHGVHYHLLVTERLAVDLVRAVGRCHGIGRVQVARADKSAPVYLAKYLSKRVEGPKTESGRAMRRWAKFGDVPHTRVKDVVLETPMWTYRRQENLPWLDYRREHLLARMWDHGKAAFKSAWFELRRNDPQVTSVIACVCGKSDFRGMGFVERPLLAVSPF